MKKVVIVGAGSQARTAHVYLSKDSQYQVSAFAVQERYLPDETLCGLNVVALEQIEKTHPPDEYALFVAIGFVRLNKVRAAVFEDCMRRGYELISYISSRATHWGEIEFGRNCFVIENTSFQPFVKVGDNVVIASGTNIGHDVVIGDHCFIGPGVVIPGGVQIGSYSLIGANATLKNDITIGSECVIGAGAVILRDTKNGSAHIAASTKASAISSAALALFLSGPASRAAGSGKRS